MPRDTAILSNDEFNACLLKNKISFKLLESARLVLVHGIPAETAAPILGFSTKNDIKRVVETVYTIVESLQDRRRQIELASLMGKNKFIQNKRNTLQKHDKNNGE